MIPLRLLPIALAGLAVWRASDWTGAALLAYFVVAVTAAWKSEGR